MSYHSPSDVAGMDIRMPPSPVIPISSGTVSVSYDNGESWEEVGYTSGGEILGHQADLVLVDEIYDFLGASPPVIDVVEDEHWEFRETAHQTAPHAYGPICERCWLMGGEVIGVLDPTHFLSHHVTSTRMGHACQRLMTSRFP